MCQRLTAVNPFRIAKALGNYIFNTSHFELALFKSSLSTEFYPPAKAYKNLPFLDMKDARPDLACWRKAMSSHSRVYKFNLCTVLIFY